MLLQQYLNICPHAFCTHLNTVVTLLDAFIATATIEVASVYPGTVYLVRI